MISQIVRAKPYHCGQMARRMRIAQRLSLLRAGLDPHRELRARFAQSYRCRAWLVDGRLAALGGVAGPLLAESGFVWLVLTEEARRYPRAIVAEARRQLAAIMQGKAELTTAIVTSDPAAIRLAAFLGFHVAHDGPGSPAGTMAARRALAREVVDNPARRIPLGGIDVVAMGYHGTPSCA